MKTYVPKAGELEKKWCILDAENKSIGRVAAVAAKLLRGKHKPQYTPYLECGDHVIVINANKVKITGNKANGKIYYRHSGYPGGLSEMTLQEMIAKFPERPMELAIKGMLPHNSLGRKLATNFRVYAGSEHPHQAQKPQPHKVD